MGRRIQGFINRVKQNESRKQEEFGIQKMNQKVSELNRDNPGMINISEGQLVSSIVSGLANAAEKPCLVKVDKPDMEISEELINMVVEKVQARQNQSNQVQANKQSEKRKSQSEQNKLQALVARLLLGDENGQQKQNENNTQQMDNPILAANDHAFQQSNVQGQNKELELKPDMTAKTASQVLAEAQYELSKELETSLYKLRQVIEESKQVAQKISNLLEQNNGGNNGSNSQN